MNPAHKQMNDFIRGRAGHVIEAQQQAPAIAQANAGNGTGTARLPKAQPQSMTAIIRQAYYSNYKGTL
jgi:hypothetical protein